MSKPDYPVGSHAYTSQHMNILSFDQVRRSIVPLDRLMRFFRSIFGERPVSLSELTVRIEEASTPALLTASINRLQDKLWQLSQQDQDRFRSIVVNSLKRHALHNVQEPMRREAANWLRLFVQSGQVSNPSEIFVTLVTVAVQASHFRQSAASDEANPYLKMLFDCFWPFRHPYQAYSWDSFPLNEVFYPLVALLQHADEETENMLIGVFAELPSLDDVAISEHLLPVALRWAQRQNAEHRRRVAPVLGRIHSDAAQECLDKLLQDSDPRVRESARDAANFGKTASS